MTQPFSRSERVWVEMTNDYDKLRRELICARNEIDRLMGFLKIVGSPVPFDALADVTLKQMGIEFAKRLSFAQRGLRGDPVPSAATQYVNERVFAGVITIPDFRADRLKENYERSHGEALVVSDDR